ncbi:Putative pilin/flagellin [Halorhabdus sp. SVX81]|uniref:DUF7261 family protein n=1 Tax=Halorhabdus sp. SVX81 TaxID=2978283 RepID=UPI0023DC6A88|nr:hypothetical protein [Halorhabdus sp. SVX81]WEL17877.1 Putative pilin/flagellin [Halorhabdus sp. SVX81]
MVIESSAGRWRALPENRRGQLLLVGAVVLAVVIVVLSLVVNTVLFTQNTDGQRVSAEVNNVDGFAFEAGKTSRSIMLRVNHAEYNRGVDALTENVTQSIGNYSAALGRSFATSGTVYANVSYRKTLRNGTRLLQTTNRNFTDPTNSNNHDWDVIQSGQETDIGWYLLNVDLRNVSADQANITVTGDTTEFLEYSMNRSEAGNGNNLSVAVSDSTGTLGTANCTATGGRVLVDLVDGEGAFDQCSFTGIEDHLESPYTVSIENGNRINGTYSIVTETVWSTPPQWSFTFPDCQTTSTPACSTPAVWNGSVNLTYRSSAIQYAQQRNITVYGGNT